MVLECHEVPNYQVSARHPAEVTDVRTPTGSRRLLVPRALRKPARSDQRLPAYPQNDQEREGKTNSSRSRPVRQCRPKAGGTHTTETFRRLGTCPAKRPTAHRSARRWILENLALFLHFPWRRHSSSED